MTPNPAVDGQFAISAYCSNTGSYQLKLMDVDGGDDPTIVSDDGPFANPAFRGDGKVLVGAEEGGGPGLWTYAADGSSASQIASLTWDADHRPFTTSPTFVGSERVAFLYGETIRTVSTSCAACSLSQTASLGERAGVDGLAWTSRAIPGPATDTPGGGGGGTGGGTGGGGAGGGGTAPKPRSASAPPRSPDHARGPRAGDAEGPGEDQAPSVLRSGLRPVHRGPPGG
jgi:hypothetical protein